MLAAFMASDSGDPPMDAARNTVFSAAISGRRRLDLDDSRAGNAPSTAPVVAAPEPPLRCEVRSAAGIGSSVVVALQRLPARRRRRQ
jgi:hypothetical protein